MTTIFILSAIILVLLIGITILLVILRGAIKSENDSFDATEVHPLTGRDIEYIRRKLVAVGIGGISLSEVFSLIQTLRDIQFGVYRDEDPWIPADTYEDIGKSIFE